MNIDSYGFHESDYKVLFPWILNVYFKFNFTEVDLVFWDQSRNCFFCDKPYYREGL